MRLSATHLTRLFALALLVLLCVELSFHLSSFPGLEGDEGWMGLRALDILQKGLFSIHGMNTHTGALFPQLVAVLFSVFGPGTFALRLPGIIFNLLALAVLLATFWQRGHAAFLIVLLFASSLLFLFYSRVAWEVAALQNFLLALIIAALALLLPADRIRFRPVALLFFAFTLGTWNHFIFLAASASFAVAAAFVALKYPGKDSARLFLLGAFNLPLQGILLLGKPLVPDGPFPTHALPALGAGLVLILATSIAYVRLESGLVPCVAAFPSRLPRLAGWLRKLFILVMAVGLIWALPYDGGSFVGMVSGYMAMERIASYTPSMLESVGLHLRIAVMVAAFAVLVFRQIMPGASGRRDAFKVVLLLWAMLFFPMLRIETLQIPDRFFFIPQFLFFVALALSMKDLSMRWRRGLQFVLALGFVQAQFFFWHEIAHAGNRQPIFFRYGFHVDNSRSFMKLDGLQSYLADRGICHIESRSYFIYSPMNFLLATKPSCPGSAIAHIEYCDNCRYPVPGFAIRVP